MSSSGLQLTSSGKAGKMYGYSMGLFELTEEVSGGQPVYRQRGGDWYLYRAGEWWLVWMAVGVEDGYLRVKAGGRGDRPPAGGWQYNSFGSSWPSDPLLVCGPPSPPCTSLTVSPHPGAGRREAKCAGRYTPLEGGYNYGRQVFRRRGGEKFYITVRGYPHGDWSISGSQDGSDPLIESSSKAGTVCPADESVTFPGVSVNCHTH